MLHCRTLLIVLIFVKVAHSQSKKNYISLPTHKEELLKIDLELIENLDQYANKLQDKIDTLQRIADEIRRPLKESSGREEEYLGNPLNSFQLIRHLYSDWELLEALMVKPIGQEQIAFLKGKLSELPLPSDLAEVEIALHRMEIAYDLVPLNLAKGIIDGVQYNAKLSSLDCYTMATHHFGMGDYKRAGKWLIAALSSMDSSQTQMYDVLKYHRSDIILMLARCFLEMDGKKVARYLLSNESNLTTEEIDDKIERLQLAGVDGYQQKTFDPEFVFPKTFKTTCRSSFKPMPSKLHCRYNTTTTPFLRLAPFRMEELSLDPYIVIFHNVMSDEEMTKLENLSAPYLKRLGVYSETVEKSHAHFRTADGVWLLDIANLFNKESNSLINRITNLVSDLTGFKLDWNGFQVLRYGFAGHYTSHYDFLNATNYTAVQGDRLATVLFYLNDVKHGGATVFPLLNLKVPAEKGKVLLFYNLDGESFDFDENTVHGACPVIDGTKMVMTSWIHELDQMFVKPNYRPGKRFF